MDNKNLENIENGILFSSKEKRDAFFSAKSTELKYKLLSKVKQSQK